VERYVIRGGRAGYDRLKVLAAAALPETAELFDRVGVGPGARCLDLACGTGDVSFELARRVGPDGHVTGIDMDEVKLELAREEAATNGHGNVDFDVGNVYDWTEPAAYDVVYCRFLLHHLSRPVDLLRSMWAGVRPGGAIVVEDADFAGAFCDPPNEGHDFYLRSYFSVLERRGGDAAAGQKLHRYFLEAGIPGASLSLRQRVHVDGDAKAIAEFTLEATADALLDEELATTAEIDAALASLTAITADPTTLIGEPRTFQAWARRSGQED
jgi:ubiquinone/menaquinone biosynthesis C-methylase UbiE